MIQFDDETQEKLVNDYLKAITTFVVPELVFEGTSALQFNMRRYLAPAVGLFVYHAVVKPMASKHIQPMLA